MNITQVNDIHAFITTLGFEKQGVVFEHGLEEEKTNCDRNARRLRDAEVLSCVAANTQSDALEIGTHVGMGTFRLASNIPHGRTVHTVNVLPEQLGPGQKHITGLLKKHEIGSFYRSRGMDNVNQLYADTLSWRPPVWLDDLGVAFIDGCHDRHAVFSDSRLAWSRLKPGGYMIWHDFNPQLRGEFDWIDTAMSGVEDFLQEEGVEDAEIFHLRDSWMGVIRKPESAFVQSPVRLGLVVDWDFHASRRWVCAITPYLVDAMVEHFPCTIISDQADYEAAVGKIDALVSMEPGWASPRLDLRRTPDLARKFASIPSYIFFSDPHKDAWRQDYFLDNGFTRALAYYWNPTLRHFTRIPKERIMHMPWALPDAWISKAPLSYHGPQKICCFGGAASAAYDLRNWCRTFPFVNSQNNSGCENKVMGDSEYFDWLGNFNAAIGAGSENPKYRLSLPKYFEIAGAGSLLFAQATEDLDRLGFAHMKNCVVFTRDTFETVCHDYLANPEAYMQIRMAGRELVRERHTISVRIQTLAQQIRQDVKRLETSTSRAVPADAQPSDMTVQSSNGNRKKLLFVVDSPGWAHDFKTNNIARYLQDEFDVQKCYQADLCPELLTGADSIIFYYWNQLLKCQELWPLLLKLRDRVMIGICSHYELRPEERDKGLMLLNRFAGNIFIHNLLLLNEFKPLLRKPVHYTPNGVDTEFYSPVPHNTNGGALRVGWAGSLTNHGNKRGYHDFIKPALENLDGFELVTAAREDKWRGPEEMRDFYRSLDYYICASRTEGTPNPCLEAAACGVPLITTRVGNMPELVQDGVNGYFIERDLEQMRSVLNTVKDKHEQGHGSLRREILHSIAGWDWKIQAEHFRRMFRQSIQDS